VSTVYRAGDDTLVSYTSGQSDAESLGAEILAMARQQQPQQQPGLPTLYESDSSSDMSGMAACAAIDDVLDNMDDEDDEPTPPKRTRPAPQRQESGVFRTPMASLRSPEKYSDLPSVVLDGDCEQPLMHSVSFYRRQKPQEVRVTPVKPVVRNREVGSSSGARPPAPPAGPGTSSGLAAGTQERINQLQKETLQQQTVMSQASQALNLCNATIEFTGSAEMVEAERLLLVATHRRQAALSEVQRLKTEGAMLQQGITRSASRGSISVSSVTLPLKSSFVREVAAGSANYVYYFVALLRYRGQVIATQMLSSEDSIKGNAVSFSNLVAFRELEADFCVSLEVYGLQTPREVLPHDAKYHIHRKERSKTPKKMLKQQSLLTSPAIQSPAGPGAVRATSFLLMGFIHLTSRNLSNNAWTLEQVSHASPLDGGVYMKVNCHADCAVEERGFITVFDDVSGFGAWHRRWCVLSGSRLSFWRYPEDEQRQPAQSVLDLRRCVTERVAPVPRDICARQNTLLLVTVRQGRPEDSDSLVMQCRGSLTRLRHLLSLDTREERQLWADQLNETLANLRAWDPDAMQPHLDPSA